MVAAGLSAGARTPARHVLVVASGAAAVVVLGALTPYSPKYAVGAVGALGLLALAFQRLAPAVGVFVVLTFPEYLPGSLGAGATLAKPLGAILALAWVAIVAARRGAVPLLSRSRPALFWVVTAFVVLAGASALWSVSTSALRYDLTRLIPDALLLLIVFTAAETAKAFRTLLWSFMLGSAVTASYAIGTGGYAASGRLSALFDPNFFAARLIPAIVIACFLLLVGRSSRVRLAAGAVLLIDLVAFVLTQSRGGIVGLAVALGAAVLLAGRARPRIVAATCVLLALGLGYYYAAAPTHLQNTFSSSGRADEWRVALRVFGDHPLAGVGLGNYPVVEPAYATATVNLNSVRYIVDYRLVAHNTYLEIAADLGIVGFFLFLAIVVLPAATAARALGTLARAPDDLQFYARGLLAGAIGMFVAFVFLSAQYDKDLWFVLGLLVGTATVARTVNAEGALARPQRATLPAPR